MDSTDWILDSSKFESHQSDISVCVIGNSRCGKTTFIRNLFGGERLQATNDTKTILQSTNYKLKQTSKIQITELLMPSSTRSRTVFQNHFNPFEFDLFFVFTDSWFTENIMWTVRSVFKMMLLYDWLFRCERSLVKLRSYLKAV